jgi:hypothetical protein
MKTDQINESINRKPLVMTIEIHKLEKEIRYLKNNLDTMDENIKPRLAEEIENMEFDLNCLRRTEQLNSNLQPDQCACFPLLT